MQLNSISVQHQTVWSVVNPDKNSTQGLINVTFQRSLISKFHSFNSGSYQWNLFALVLLWIATQGFCCCLGVCVREGDRQTDRVFLFCFYIAVFAMGRDQRKMMYAYICVCTSRAHPTGNVSSRPATALIKNLTKKKLHNSTFAAELHTHTHTHTHTHRIIYVFAVCYTHTHTHTHTHTF